MSIEKEIPIPRGSDQTFEIVIKSENNSLIDLSGGYSNVIIAVYNADKTVLDKFSIVSGAGYKSIDTTYQSSGKLSFTLESDITGDASLGKKYIEVHVKKTDSDLGDGNYDMKVNGKYLCTITESITNNLTEPGS